MLKTFLVELDWTWTKIINKHNKILIKVNAKPTTMLIMKSALTEVVM